MVQKVHVKLSLSGANFNHLYTLYFPLLQIV